MYIDLYIQCICICIYTYIYIYIYIYTFRLGCDLPSKISGCLTQEFVICLFVSARRWSEMLPYRRNTARARGRESRSRRAPSDHAGLVLGRGRARQRRGAGARRRGVGLRGAVAIFAECELACVSSGCSKSCFKRAL